MIPQASSTKKKPRHEGGVQHIRSAGGMMQDCTSPALPLYRHVQTGAKANAFPYPLRQLFANAAMAASRVGS
jgi:hypothetical protein